MEYEDILDEYMEGHITKHTFVNLVICVGTPENVDSIMEKLPAEFYDDLKHLVEVYDNTIAIGNPKKAAPEALQAFRDWFNRN